MNKVRKIWIAVLTAIAVMCASIVALTFVRGGGNSSVNNSKDGSGNSADIGIPGNGASVTAGALSANAADHVFTLQGTNAQMEKIWNEAMGKSGTVSIVLNSNWTAVGGSFGASTGVGFTSTGGLLIPENKNITINLNGHNIDRGLTAVMQFGQVITIKSSSSLETTLTINGSGEIKGGKTGNHAPGSVYENYNGGAGIFAEATSTLNIYGGKITGNTALFDGGVFSQGTVNMYGGEVSNNTATTYSGGGIGISTSGSAFNMYGGVIKNNTATVGTGGGVCCSNGGVFSMYGGTISDNTADSGAGVLVSRNAATGYATASFDMYGGTINHNITTSAAGGGILVDLGCQFNMQGGTISNNEVPSGQNGSAIEVNNGSTLLIYDGMITGNKPADAGAVGTYGSSVTVYMEGGYIVNNTSIGIKSGQDTASNIGFAGGVISANAGGVKTYSASNTATGKDNVQLRGPVQICANNNYNLDLGMYVVMTIPVPLTVSGTNGSYIEPNIGVTASYQGTNTSRVITSDASNWCGDTSGFSLISVRRFMFSDNDAKIIGISGNTIVLQDGSRTVPTWTYKINGDTKSATGAVVSYYGDDITEIKAQLGSNIYTWTKGSNNSAHPCVQLWSSDYDSQGMNLTNLDRVGNYQAFLWVPGSAHSNPKIPFIVLPRPVTVNIDDKSSNYGDSTATLTASVASSTPLVGSDSLASLGITLTKDAGDEVGTYQITGTSTNPNYDVTFVNGEYEIKQTTVDVIINGQQEVYGSKYYALKKAYNDTPVKGEAPYTVDPDDSTKYYDKNGKLVDSTGDLLDSNGNKIYNGGWRYKDATPSVTFVGDDLTKPGRFPFTLSCSGTGFTDITDNTNTNYIAAGDYTITYSVNPNYKVNFYKEDGTANTAQTGTMKIKPAELGLMGGSDYASKKGGGAKTYESVDYDASAHRIELPTAAFTGTDSKDYNAGVVLVKGDMGTSDVSVLYIIYKSGETGTPEAGDADDKALLDPKNTTKWAAGVSAGTATEKTAAGSYIVYSLVTAANHESKVFKWTYSIGAKTTAFRLDTYWGTGSSATKIATTDSGTTIPDADKAKAVYDGTKTAETKILFVDASGTATGATDTTCKTLIYYKNTSPKSDTDSTWKYGAWDSTFTRLETTDTTSPKYKFSSDKKYHEDYGTTEKPKNGGTYTATVVEDPSVTNGYNLATGGRSLTFTVNAKEIAVPTNSDDFTYDGTDRKFTIDGFDKKTMQISGDPTMDGTDPTGLSYDTPNNFLPTENGTTYKLVAKNAGEYKVNFKIKSGEEDNYKWKTKKPDPDNPSSEIDIDGFNSDKSEYELKLTIKKAQLKATFTSPQKSIDSTKSDLWTWAFEAYKGSKDDNNKPNALIRYAIDDSSIISVGGVKESVTVELKWAVKPATSGTALSDKDTGVIADPDTSKSEKVINVDNGAFKKDTYYVYLVLTDDSAGADVNKNYQTLVVDDTTKLPKGLDSNGKGDCVQQFTVGDGNASVSGIVWHWKGEGPSWTAYVKNSKKDDPDNPGTQIPAPELDTLLTYKLGADKNAVAYVLEMDTSTSNGFPTYFDTTGLTYTTKYCATENGTYTAAANTTNAGYYKTSVRLTVKSGETIKFVNASDKGYTYVSDTQADYEFAWKIAKYKIDPNDVVELGYKIKNKKDSTLGEFNKFTAVKEGDETVYEVGVPDGGNGIVVAVNLPADLTKEPYDVSVILKSGTISGKGTNISPETKQTAAGTYLSTTIPFSILTGASDNYEFAKDGDGNILSSITIKWRVVASTIPSGEIVWSEPDPEDPTKYVDGDGHPTTLTGEVDEIDKDGNKTGKKITVTLPTPKLKAGDDKVEYVYVWNDGTEEKVFKGLQGLYELISISERTYGGGILPGDVKVKAEAKDGYRLDPSVPTTGLETPVVIGDTKIRVQVTAEGKLEGSYKDMDVRFKVEELDASGNASEYDPELYTLWIYPDGDESKKVKFSTEELNKLTSGKHAVVLELVNTVGYKIALGSERFEITVNKIELEIPTMVNNPTFSGAEQNAEELLDYGYKAIKDLVTVSGQNSARNKGSYTLVITIKDTDNYVWKASGKSAAKYVLAEDVPVPESTRVSDAEVDIGWQILPYAIAVTPDMWSVSKEKDAKLNVEIPAGMEAVIGYNYYESKAGGTALSELSNGASVWASAVLTGADAENGNVVFADSGINETSERVAHTVVIPKSGFAAAASTALNFVKKNWLWFAIGGGIFLFLLLLIIILAATKRKRKEKAEERKLEKERKAEEKARKEEERRLKEEQREEEKRRREQEREDAKAKAEAERELQKAKAEAELAKMRAEMGMAGAGAMAMQAMAQPQQQMPMQQAMPQQMQMPQQPQYPQMPQPYYPQQPMMQQMPMQGGGADSSIMALMQAQLAEMRAEKNSDKDVAALKTELEIMKLKLEQSNRQQQPQYFVPSTETKSGQAIPNAIPMDMFGAMMFAAFKKFTDGNAEQKPVKNELPQKTEESAPTTVSTPTVYPPDAVITTTTTVDTTKTSATAKQPQRVSRGNDNTIFDIDGFYDTFEENK